MWCHMLLCMFWITADNVHLPRHKSKAEFGILPDAASLSNDISTTRLWISENKWALYYEYGKVLSMQKSYCIWVNFKHSCFDLLSLKFNLILVVVVFLFFLWTFSAGVPVKILHQHLRNGAAVLFWSVKCRGCELPPRNPVKQHFRSGNVKNTS